MSAICVAKLSRQNTCRSVSNAGVRGTTGTEHIHRHDLAQLPQHPLPVTEAGAVGDQDDSREVLGSDVSGRHIESEMKTYTGDVKNHTHKERGLILAYF